MKTKHKKIVLSGYYGFNNFGDDAILQILVREIKLLSNNIQIVVLSKNPEVTAKKLQVKSVDRLNILDVTKELVTSNILISGGGSLLQDITGPLTLYYYLGVILLAKLLGNKVFIYAQGIGPIDRKVGQIATKLILNLSNIITVRDLRSKIFLEQLKIASEITSDPVWLGINKSEKIITGNEKTIGINLRPWKTLDEKKLNDLAESISQVIDNKTKLIIIPLQYNQDYTICSKFETLLRSKNPELNIDFITEELDPSGYDKIIQNCKVIIAMRFHALITSLTYNIKTFGISYDPKVTSLMEESNTEFVKISELNEKDLKIKLKRFLSERKKPNNNEFVTKNIKLARENVNKLKYLLENN